MGRKGGVDKRGGHEGNAGNKNADIQVSFSTARSGKGVNNKNTRARTKKMETHNNDKSQIPPFEVSRKKKPVSSRPPPAERPTLM